MVNDEMIDGAEALDAETTDTAEMTNLDGEDVAEDAATPDADADDSEDEQPEAIEIPVETPVEAPLSWEKMTIGKHQVNVAQLEEGVLVRPLSYIGEEFEASSVEAIEALLP